jgi:hypothetical protein
MCAGFALGIISTYIIKPSNKPNILYTPEHKHQDTTNVTPAPKQENNDKGFEASDYKSKDQGYQTHEYENDKPGFDIYDGDDSYILFKDIPDTVEKIGGRYPINAEYAGKVYDLKNLPETIKSKFPDILQKYPEGVRFSEKGFPDFTPYAQKTVDITGLIGDHDYDFKEANRIAGIKRIPEGFTWHHHENGKTMQLVPQDLHYVVKHTGGCSTIKNGLCK